MSAGPGKASADLRATSWLLALLIGFALVLFVRLPAAPVHRPNELRVDKVMRGMVQTGDLLVPRLDGETRLQKPPLYYWCATAAAWIAGGVGNGPLRAPAALASLAMVLVAWSWGRRLGGPRLGLAAAISVAIMPGVSEFGRLGVAETTLAACSAAAMLAWDRARDGSRSARLWFVVALAGAVLAKGTPILLTVALPIAADLLLRRRLRAACTWRNAGLFLLACAPAVAWYVALFVSVPGAWDQVVSFAVLPVGVRLPAARGNASHIEPVWYHANALLGMIIPLIPLLPPLLLRGWRSRLWRDEPGLRLAALSFVLPFIGFSLIPEKQDHYLLPLLPPLAVLLGATLLELGERAAAGARALRAVAVIWALLLLVGCGAATWVLAAAFELGPVISGAMALAGLLLAAGVLWAAWRARALASFGVLAAGVLLLTGFWFALVNPVHERMASGMIEPAEVAHWREVAGRHPLVGRVFVVNEAPESG